MHAQLQIFQRLQKRLRVPTAATVPSLSDLPELLGDALNKKNISLIAARCNQIIVPFSRNSETSKQKHQ